MRCRYGLAVLLYCLLAVSLSAQVESSPIPTWLPTGLPPLSEQLGKLATTLEQALSDSATDWDTLSSVLTEHSRKLDELAMSSLDLEQEIKSMQASLAILDQSLRDSIAMERRRSVQAALWRVGTLSGAIGIAGAMADAGKARGAAIGASLGAVAGAIWWAAEAWPRWGERSKPP